ncbi:MAG: BamA/TamA family outer membrane protein [Candidatus Eisenbacteria bacterium]
MVRTRPFAFAIAALALIAPLAAPARAAEATPADTMVFRPLDEDSAQAPAGRDGVTLSASIRVGSNTESQWLKAPVGDNMLTHPDEWRAIHGDKAVNLSLLLDYNRVDLVRWGAWYQAQAPATMFPRLAGRIERATGRNRWLYGAQIEQPLLPTARFVAGVSMTRRTDHGDLQQVEDGENSAVLFLAHEDWRDYFEREGLGAYLSWRVPDFSTVSVHVRRDEYRSLDKVDHVTSWFRRDRVLRDNPAIDEGESHSVLLRSERLTRNNRTKRAGLYHWLELERSGGQVGGDFDYTRAFADVRSILRLSPALTLSLRGVAGSTLQGDLPRQREFVIGGVDGMRAHAIGSMRGDQVAMMQAEYAIGLWQLRTNGFDGGLHALLFVDAGRAWQGEDRWDVGSQKFAVDGGIGLSTSDDNMRVTLARDLQDPDSKFVAAMRLRRPF